MLKPLILDLNQILHKKSPKIILFYLGIKKNFNINRYTLNKIYIVFIKTYNCSIFAK